ncbi:unnamed protein product [Rotaria sp. Silwood2]|nr:unnamed protein product [Rotaria sp. Silwood2]CAF4313695.1 unnamed protein product [Rotaria sp. Silwood2]
MPNIKLRLLALAPHVHDYARWFTKRRFSIDVWYPVFPLDLPLTTESKSLKFTIQGKFSGKRRNYDSLASQIQRKYKVLQQRNITFLVIGTGNDNLQHPLRQSSAVRWLIQKKPTPAASYYKLIHRTAVNAASMLRPTTEAIVEGTTVVRVRLGGEAEEKNCVRINNKIKHIDNGVSIR